MLRIEVLPAGHGDCLWIEYGDPKMPRRLLVDGGTAGCAKPLAKRIEALPSAGRRFELLVVTHVDADHIAGVLKVFEKPNLGMSFGDVWFNAYKHLGEGPGEVFGPEQGETLSAYIDAAKLPWNRSFGGRAVMVADAGLLPVAALDGGLEFVVLGPTRGDLRKLKPVWKKACEAAGLKAGMAARRPKPPGLESFGPLSVDKLADAPFEEDKTEANGSSISLLLRYEGTTVLLGADAHPRTLEAAIHRLEGTNGRLKIDAFKVPHHGSQNNVSRALLGRVRCSRYLLSTNGAYYKHPNREAVARVLKYGRPGRGTIDLVFNYRTDLNDIWDSVSLKKRWEYTTSYPSKGDGGVVGFEKR
jgi:beta-lactamase superfamily II metal-dependent hydrolase